MYRPRRNNFPLLLLALQIYRLGFDKIPPITLALVFGQSAIFLNLLSTIRFSVPAINEICSSPINVWYKKEWQRLLFSSFFHLDEWHLYFNMISLLWKGIVLEKRMGSSYFLFLVIVFSVLSDALTVILGIFMERITNDPSYLHQCSVGFSGTLFALKVVKNSMSQGDQSYVMGIPVPGRMACWAELLLIHFMVPNSSFLGHLSGILVGLLYTNGPLKSLMDTIYPLSDSYRAPTIGGRSWWRWPAFAESRHTATASTSADQRNGGLSEEEALQEAIFRSQDEQSQATHRNLNTSSPSPPYPHQSSTQVFPSAPSIDEPAMPPYPTALPPHPVYPDEEEMRRRRLARFS